MTIEGTQLEQWAREYGEDPEYLAEGAANEVVESALSSLAEKGKTLTWLGAEMGVSKQRVSYMLNTTPNFTFVSLFKLAKALGVKARVIFDSENYFIREFDSSTDPKELEEQYITDLMIKRSKQVVDSRSTDNLIANTSRRVLADASAT